MQNHTIIRIACGAMLAAVLAPSPPANAGTELSIQTNAAPRIAEADRLIEDARGLLRDTDPARVATMTLRECLYVTLHNSLDIAIQQLEPDMADADVQAAQGAFDPELFANFTQTQSSTPQSTRAALSAGGAQSIDQEQTILEGGVRGTVASGLEYEFFGNRTGTNSTLNSAAGISSEYEVEGRATFTQPVLRDFGIAVNTAPIQIARRRRSISEADFVRQTQQTITDVHNAYWEVVRTRENLRVTIDSLRVARDLLRQNQIRLEVGTMAPLEVLQAETGVATRTEALIVARQAVHDAEDELKRLMNLPDSTDAWKLGIRPQDAPTASAPNVHVDALVSSALAERPDLRAARLELDNADVDVMVAHNQMLPDLRVTGEYGTRGIDSDVHEAFDQAGRTHKENWRLAADFSYPVFNRDARGKYRRAGLARRQQALSIEDLELDITAEVRGAARAVETAWQRIGVTDLASRLATKQLEAEQKKLEVGVSTSFDVLEFEQDLTEAKSNKIAAQIDYQQALAQLDLAVSRTLATHDIAIDQGQG